MGTGTTFDEEPLNNNEGNSPAENQSGNGGSKPRKNNANRGVEESKEDARKRRDALEGKDKKEARSESEKGSTKGSGPKEDGAHSTSSKSGLQSAQTTVQFSTGGNVASLGSLMGLLASSSSLARTEHGGFVNVSQQATNLSTRLLPQSPTYQTTNFLEGGGKSQKETSSTNLAPAPELGGNNFVLQTSGSALVQSVNSLQDAFSGLFKGIRINAVELQGDAAPPILVPPLIVAGSIFVPVFNSNTVFLPPEIIFAFTNSPTPYSNVISNYLTDAGLKASTSYTYVFDPSTLPEGLTLTDTGDLTVNVTAPTSALVVVKANGTEVITVRISAGPGVLVEDSPAQTDTFVANPVGPSMFSTGTVTRISGEETVVGNAVDYNPTSTDWVDGSLSLPGNVIFRHVFEQTDDDISTIVVPKASVYGNFETGTITIPDGVSPVSLKLGGNLLDVYGSTENGLHGIGNSLTLNYTATSAPSTVTFAGNILAGFGIYYGDFQTFTINDSSSANQTINFGPNQLYVDKAVASIIFPNIENLNITDPNTTNLTINFSNNIIKGNQTSDIFYGQIAKLGDLNNASLYNGFLKGVTVTSSADGKHVVTTTAEGNSITWGNDVYTGGGQNPNTPDVVAKDTYNFTLLGTPKITDITDVKAVAQGNITITDFNRTTDTLKLQLTPDLFKGIDIDYNKKITAADLDAATTFVPTETGTRINFAGGGSITLNGVYTSFSQITNLETAVVDQTYIPIAVAPLTENGPFLYGNGPRPLTFSYFNELDNFFSNSLLANYRIDGVTPTLVSGVLEYTIAPGVVINQYGTITVTTSTPILQELTLTAIDERGNPVTTTEMFGFLDAPTTIIAAGETKGASRGADIIKSGAGSTIIGEDTGTYIVPPITPGIALTNQTISFGSNLIVSTDGGSTVYGDYKIVNLTAQGTGSGALTTGSSSAATFGAITGNTFNFNANAFYVVDGIAVYGVAQNFNATAQGGTGNSITTSSGQTTSLSINDSGTFNDNTINFGTQTFYGSGVLYGDLQNLTIKGLGGSNALISVGSDASTSINSSSQFNNNDINFAETTFKIAGGTIYGNVQNIDISATAGSNGKFTFTAGPANTSSGSINLSSQVMDNTFSFKPVNITISGDTAGDTTTVYGSVENISITTQSTYSKVIGADYTIDTSATFSGNSFILGDVFFKAGTGNTVFYSDPKLNTNTSIYAYNGFINPLVVTVVGNHVVTTTADGLNNSITWGNDTLEGGVGTNTYNFSLLQNKEGSGNLDKPDAIFTGFDTITNFDKINDILTFNVDANLYKEILAEIQAEIAAGATGLDGSQVTAAALDLVATFAYIDGNTIISFDGGGSLTLKGIHIESFTELGSNLVINQGTSIYHTPPTLNTAATFDPVFVNVTQPNAFGEFITNANPLNLHYKITDSSKATALEAQGITLSDNGTLTVKANGLVDTEISVTATDGTTTIILPTVHIFAIDAPLTYYDNTSTTIFGVQGPMAYEVTAAGTVYGGGGVDLALSGANTNYGSKLIYNTSTTPHLIYGVVQNITNSDTASINGKIYTFASNLLNIAPGAPFDSTDQIFGNAQNLEISVSADANNGFTGNTLEFGSNIIYGSGTVFGNIQTISLTDLSSTASIQGNDFTFGGNTLTSGAYTTSTTFQNSGGITNLFGNVEKLMITGSDVNNIKSNTFTFGDNTLKGGSGDTNFYGDLVNFGNSNNPDLYGSKGFYDGVTVETSTNSDGDTVITITDGNNNAITWGNDIYEAGTGVDTFNFTIVGTSAETEGSTPAAVMQGFDTIKNFNLGSDKLTFSIAYPVYVALAGLSALTASGFLDKLAVTQSDNEATITFSGGGSIVLTGYGESQITLDDLEAGLANSINVNVADPITAKTLSTQTFMIFGNTSNLDTWSNLFNTGHLLDATVNGITLKEDGSVDFGSNTGIIDTVVTSVTASDVSGTSATATGPIRVVALDATVIDQATGTVNGTTDANVIIGHGNKILGGGADIVYTAKDGVVETPVNVTYGEKLIYNDAPEGTGSVTGDVQNVKFAANGVKSDINTTPLPPPPAEGEPPAPLPSADLSNNMSLNVIDFGDVWIFSNAISPTYGNVQNISMNAVGGTNIFSNGIILDNQNVNGNEITSGNNTITASGNIFGVAQNVSLEATSGFYSAAAGSTAQASISNNIFQAGGNTLTGNNGSFSSIYGNYQTLTMTLNSPANTDQSTPFKNAVTASSADVIIGTSVIDDNTFTFSGNTLVGGDMDSTLFAGLGKLVMTNNEQSISNTTQAPGSSISDNHITFGNSTLTATGGITHFNNDIDDLSQTNFDDYDVTAKTVNGHVQITDIAGADNDALIHGNMITFGNNTMTADATGVNIFNLDLFSTTTGNIVAEGNTTIKNFGAPGVSNENMLNLQISEALYNDLTAYAVSKNITLETTSDGVSLITANLLDSYMAANNGTITHSGGNTTFNFSDAALNKLGSITLTGVNVNSLEGLGSDLGITANGVTTIQAKASASNIYDIAISGDSASDFTQNVQLFTESSDPTKVGTIVDFTGEIDLNLSSAFFKAAGLSESHTDAQNFQTLLDNATNGSQKSGIAVTSSATDTILSFTSGGNTYGSITLNNVHLTPTELAPILNITHT